MKNNSIKVDGKVYAKTMLFGNCKATCVHKNRKKYVRVANNVLRWLEQN